MTKRRFWVIVGAVTFCTLFYLLIQGILFMHDGQLHVIFCDVGQGDGILIKSPEGKILTIDGGPDESMSTCLTSRLPFWITRIDLMIVTHPHVDHFAGDIALLNRYTVARLITEDLTSSQEAYQLLMKEVKDKGIPHKTLHLGDAYKIGRLSLLTVGPSDHLLKRSSPQGEIGESKEFASLLLKISFGKFSILFPGDSQAQEMEEAIHTFKLHDMTILQSPHHGSGTGVNHEIVSTLHPKLAVISVGAKNRYHHPSPSTLSIYNSLQIPVKRTDKEGTIEIITDGRTYREISAN